MNVKCVTLIAMIVKVCLSMLHNHNILYTNSFSPLQGAVLHAYSHAMQSGNVTCPVADIPLLVTCLLPKSDPPGACVPGVKLCMVCGL